MLTSDAVEHFLEAKRSANRRPATLAYYAYELARLTKAYPELPLDAKPLRKVLLDVRDKPSELGKPPRHGAPASEHATFRALRAFYRFLVYDEIIPTNPMARVEAPKLPKQRQRTLDEAEVERLLDEAQLTGAPATSHAPGRPRPAAFRDYTILTLLLDSAIRSGELRGLRGRDLREGKIDVRGKKGERTVPVHPDTMVLLRRLAKGPDDPIFRTEQGRPLTRRRLHAIITMALHRVSLAQGGKHGPHMLRHTFGRWWIANYGTLPALKDILGHEDITTTMIYVDLAGTEVERQHREHSQLTTRAGGSGLRKVV